MSRISIPRISYHHSDLFFRVTFSLIFLALGLEHLFSDDVIQSMMPAWLGDAKRPLSILAGVVLLAGGGSVFLGWRLHQGAAMLATFLVIVTLVVHVPALFSVPEDLPESYGWLWDVYQRSNLIKNLCLLGGCVHFLNHRVGKYSLGER